MAEFRHRQLLGQRGEAEANAYLRAQGYVIVAKNYRSPYGEIDLIVEDKRQQRTIIFVEVRSNSDPRFGDPLASVNHKKQRQITRTALYYLLRNRMTDREARFDVIGIRWEAGQAQISHIMGAFEAADA